MTTNSNAAHNLEYRKMGGKVSFSGNWMPDSVNEEDSSIELVASTGARGLRVPWFDDPYYEELGMESKNIRLERFNSGAPLLDTHNNYDLDDQIGVIERAWVADKKLHARVRFRSNEKSQGIFKDVANGTIRNVSVGYKTHEMVESKAEGDEFVTRKAVDWEPMELSFVPINFDKDAQTRSESSDHNVIKIRKSELGPQADNSNHKENEMTTPATQPVETGTNTNQPSNVEIIRSGANQALEMIELGEKFEQRELAREFIQNGRSMDELRSAILDKMGTNTRTEPMNPATEAIGLTNNETKQYSLIRAIAAAATGNWAGAGFEREVSEAAKKTFKRDTSGFLIPTDVLSTRLVGVTTGDETNMSGGAFVDDELQPQSFIDILRNRLVIRRLGARVLDNLVGDLSIPKQTGGADTFWVAEGKPVGDTNQTTSQVPLSPKTVGARTDISRKLLLQSSIAAEQFVKNDIAASIARELDRVTVFGSGKDSQPLGIAGIQGVNQVSLGTNGGKLTYSKLVEMETLVSVANADQGNLAYLTNAKVRGFMKTALKADGIPGYLWESTMQDGDGSVNGYRTAITNMIPHNLEKGNKKDLSAIIFGNWADVLIGEWGVLDVQVNPYGPGSDAGTVRVRSLQDVDVAVRHPESFSMISDVIA